MKFTLSFDCGNAAFGDGYEDRIEEIARILHECADRIERRELTEISGRFPIRDANGNRVGFYSLAED